MKANHLLQRQNFKIKLLDINRNINKTYKKNKIKLRERIKINFKVLSTVTKNQILFLSLFPQWRGIYLPKAKMQCQNGTTQITSKRS